MRGNELFRRILDVDPELLLPYLLDRRGRSQELILAALTAQLVAGQKAGLIRRGDPTPMARGIVLAAHGTALSAHTMTGDGVTEDDLDTELGVLIERGLRP